MADGEHAEQRDGRLLAGRYRLLSVVGSGGMGTVWRARDETLDREVAVKEVVLHRALSEEELQTRLRRTLREARASARLNHPGVVTVHDVVDEDDRPWIVMELVPARSLQEIVDEDGPLPPARVAAIGRQIVAALRAAHAFGILHRDVKPANVLVASGDRAVLTDFGIAQLAGDATLTHTGLLVGSPAYMSPERVKGDRAIPASDLWALGATLYTACEGRPPHHRIDPMAVLAAVMTQEPPPARNAGPLAPVLMGMLERDPVRRMGAGPAEEALAAVAAGAAVGAGPGTNGAAPAGQTAPDESAGTAAVPSPRTPHAAPASPAPAPAPGLTEYFTNGAQSFQATGSAPAPGPGRAKRRSMVPALLGAVVAAVLVAAGAAFFWLDGGPGGAAAGTSPSPSPSTSPSVSAPPSAGDPKTSPPAADAVPPVPPGFRRVSGPGFTIAVPAGWRRQDQSRSTLWIDPVSKAYVQVDRRPWTGEPSDPYEHWVDWERNAIADGNMPGFRRLSITRTTAGSRPAADIEFVWDRAGGTRARDRGVYISEDLAYGVMVAVPAAEWSRYATTVNNVLDTFRP